MGNDIGKIYKHGQPQFSNLSLKTSVSSSSEPQTSSAIEFKKMSVPSVTDTNKKKYVLYSQNTIQNDATITKNDDIQSCEAAKKQNYSIPTISTPNHPSKYIATTSSSRLNFNTSTILPPFSK